MAWKLIALAVCNKNIPNVAMVRFQVGCAISKARAGPAQHRMAVDIDNDESSDSSDNPVEHETVDHKAACLLTAMLTEEEMKKTYTV